MTNGRASRYPYPENLRSRQYNIYLNSGYTDDMMDFETGPVVGAKNAVRQLKMLEQIVISHLRSDERLWPLSMAPGPTYQHDLEYLQTAFTKKWDQETHDYLGKKYGIVQEILGDVHVNFSLDGEFQHDLEYLQTAFTKKWDQETHDYLGKKYGIVQEILGDVHVNFSLDGELINEIYHRFYTDRYPNRIDFQNHLYFKLAQKFYLYQWLFTYLYGASPVSEDMPHSIPEDLELPVRSLRCSDYGDDNFTNEQVTYTSYDQHFAELKHFMDNGTYYSMKEFFGPVRLRRHNHDMHDIDGALQEGIDYLEFRNFDLDPLSRTGISDDTINFPVRLRRHNHDMHDIDGALQEGIDYLEFRNFDLDPLSRTGISDDTINFLELMLLNSILSPLPDNLEERLAEAKKRNNEVALQKPKEQLPWDTINFLELMLLNSILSPLPDNLEERLAEAKKRNNEVALQKPKEQLPWMHEEAMQLIAELQNFIVEFNAPREYQLALKFVQRRVDDPSLTLSGQLADQLENGDLLSFGLKIANDRYTKNINFQHPLQAISDVYSDNVQQLVKAAKLENGDLLSFGLKIANDRYTKNINFQHPLQAISDVYSDNVQQLVKAAIELGVQIDLQPTRVVLHVGDHQESYNAQATFDFSKGARDVILSDFPEVQDFQEK